MERWEGKNRQAWTTWEMGRGWIFSITPPHRPPLQVFPRNSRKKRGSACSQRKNTGKRQAPSLSQLTEAIAELPHSCGHHLSLSCSLSPAAEYALCCCCSCFSSHPICHSLHVSLGGVLASSEPLPTCLPQTALLEINFQADRHFVWPWRQWKIPPARAPPPALAVTGVYADYSTSAAQNSPSLILSMKKLKNEESWRS